MRRNVNSSLRAQIVALNEELNNIQTKLAEFGAAAHALGRAISRRPLNPAPEDT